MLASVMLREPHINSHGATNVVLVHDQIDANAPVWI
jgi:hypothetical protein